MNTNEYYLDNFVDYLNKNDKSSGTISTYITNIYDFIKYYTESYGEEFNPGNTIMMDLQDYRNYLLNIKRQKASTINNSCPSMFSDIFDRILRTIEDAFCDSNSHHYIVCHFSGFKVLITTTDNIF